MLCTAWAVPTALMHAAAPAARTAKSMEIIAVAIRRPLSSDSVRAALPRDSGQGHSQFLRQRHPTRIDQVPTHFDPLPPRHHVDSYARANANLPPSDFDPHPRQVKANLRPSRAFMTLDDNSRVTDLDSLEVGSVA